MTYEDNSLKGSEMAKPEDAAIEDLRFEQALGNFRRSVHAWSENAFPQPRELFETAARPFVWRRPLAWALGVLMTAGVASGAAYEHHHRQVLAFQAQQRELERQRTLADQHAGDIDDLLAKVDRDISQEVPDALEPLAQMMSEDNSR